MPLTHFTCTDFRCLREATFSPEAQYNLIYGANASGKTSLLEAIAYLGRGRSFRGATTLDIVNHAANEFVLFGRVDNETREAAVGVRNSRAGLEIHIDGDKVNSAAGLAEILPLQVVDPDIHNLVAGGPEERRRYLDWIAFHVEPGYLEHWRRFRRALKQRNAALKAKAAISDREAWDTELLEIAPAVDLARRNVAGLIRPVLEQISRDLLGSAVKLDYRPGWPEENSFAESLKAGIGKDVLFGSTQSGPHRADLSLSYDEHRAKRMVSRGQQKLLASAMTLAATQVVQQHLGRPLVLLVDDPAAELDAQSLSRLMSAVVDLGSQVIATALEPNEALFPERPRLFHVEQGVLENAD